MTSIIDRLNSGELHTAARARRPDCVDGNGNIHVSPERARFVDWMRRMKTIYGDDVAEWPAVPREEYARKYVPSH